MKKIICIALCLLSGLTAGAQSLLEQGNTAYNAKEFDKAAQLYEESLKSEGVSAGLYYNLGNAYFRLNRLAPAILNYERALLLEPGNNDIRYNLAFARAKTVDKIEPVGEFFLATAFRKMQNTFTTNQWSTMAIACFFGVMLGVFLFFFTRRLLWRKSGFFGGLAFLALCILTNVFAFNQKRELTHRNEAIVLSATTTIKSSPDQSGTDLFILHEGTKVEITNSLGEWRQVETADGNVGWIPAKEIEGI